MKLRKREVVEAGRKAPAVLPKGSPIKKKPKPQPRVQQPVMRSINDICLAESLACLSRAELDSLPLVGRRFERVLSTNVSLQHAPLRLLPNMHVWRAKYGYTAFTFEASYTKGSDIKKLRVLFNDAFGDQQVAGNKWANRVRFHTHVDEFLAVMDKYPWLRVKHVHLTIPFSTLAGRTEKVVAEWSAMRRLWEGTRLELYAEMPKSYRTRLADIGRVDIAHLIGSCGELIAHSTPEKMLFTLPLDAERLADITLYGERLELTPKSIVAYLFGRGDGEKERSLLCKTLYYDAAQKQMVDELVGLIKQRISSTSQDAIPPFLLNLTYTSRDYANGSPNTESYILRHDELDEDKHAPHCVVELWYREYVSIHRRGRDVKTQASTVEVRYIKPGLDTGR